MVNVYADLAAVKSAAALNVPDGAHDARLLGLLEAASRWIDGYCGRDFAAVAAERRFDGKDGSRLFLPDLVSVSRLRTRIPGGQWTEWPADAYRLYPLDAAPTSPGGRPYTQLAVADGAGRRFPVGRAAVSINGVWGYGSVREDTGLRIAAGAALTADASEIIATPADAALSAGHTIRIDDEELYVAAAAVAMDAGTTTLTVKRGVNGSIAATHVAASGIAAYRYPAAVSEACLRLAMAWWRERVNAAFAPAPPGTGDAAGDGIDPAARALLEPFRRRLAALGAAR